MPAAFARVGVGGERLVEVDEDGARDVAGVVGVTADATVQVRAHVGDDGALGDLGDDGSDHALKLTGGGRGVPPANRRRGGVFSGMNALLLTALATALLVLAAAGTPRCG